MSDPYDHIAANPNGVKWLELALASDVDRQLHEREPAEWTRRDQWAADVLNLLRQGACFWFPVSQMRPEDLEAERDQLEAYFRECERIGQGISTKESVRHRDLLAEIERRKA